MSASDSFWLIIWELIAAIGVIVVIVGIIGEGSELLVKWALKTKYKKFQKELDDGFRWFLAILMKFVRPRILEVETFAFALVVLGLVAEFWGGHKSQQILDRNNSRLNLAAEQLGKTNAQLSLQVELLKSNNLALYEEIQPRRITPEKKKILVDLLKNAPKGKVTVGSRDSDLEAWVYMRQIADVLKTSGFETETNDVIAGGPTCFGIAYLLQNNNPAPIHAVMISKIFESQGISSNAVSVDVETNMPAGYFEIWVGTKPPPE
jgi:hypothetical protein